MLRNDDLDAWINMGDEEDALLCSSVPESLPAPIRVKFFSAYENAKVKQSDVTSEKNEAHCVENHLGEFKDGTLTLASKTYSVKEIRRDGSGVAVLVLSDDV